MNKVISTYKTNIDVFQIENVNTNEFNCNIGWNRDFIQTIKTNSTKQKIRLEVIPTASGPYFVTKKEENSAYPMEITSENSRLIGYPQTSNSGSSTALSETETRDLGSLLFQSDYILDLNSPLQQLLSQKLAESMTNDYVHVILSSKDCIVGVRIFMKSTQIKSILPTLRDTIRTTIASVE